MQTIDCNKLLVQVEYTAYKDADGRYVDEDHPQATAVRSCSTSVLIDMDTLLPNLVVQCMPSRPINED